MVTKNCEWCKKPHEVRQADLNRGWGRFCSKVCKAKEQESRTGQNMAFREGKALKRFPTTLPAKTGGTGIDRANGWKWRVNGGRDFLRPCDMATSHLFYTLRMIWNHTMPATHHVGGSTNEYNFGSYYTAAYMKTAIIMIGRELLTRDDIKPEHARQLEVMKEFIMNPPADDQSRIKGEVKTEPKAAPRSAFSDLDYLKRMLDRKRVHMVMEDEFGNQIIEDSEDEGHDDYMYGGDGWGGRCD